MKKVFFKLEERLFNFKSYRPQDDFGHRNLFNGVTFNGTAFNRDAFNQSIDEDYYRPIRTKSAFNGN